MGLFYDEVIPSLSRGGNELVCFGGGNGCLGTITTMEGRNFGQLPRSGGRSEIRADAVARS